MPTTAGNPLRVSDLVPLRRVLGTDSIVIRVHENGTLAPFTPMPTLFFDRAIGEALSNDVDGRFNEACQRAVKTRASVAFQADDSRCDVVMINPILDDDGDACRLLVCWVRNPDVTTPVDGLVAWVDLQLDDVVTRYRQRPDVGSNVVEASPWWTLTNSELLELWPHHSQVSAMGLGHAVMEALITDAAEAAACYGGGAVVRISIPSADILAGLVPVFAGALRASRLEPHRLVAAIEVDLAVDPDLLPIIVHLRTIGIQIDIVGLDELTDTLYRVKDSAAHVPKVRLPSTGALGEWVSSFAEAASVAA